MADKRRFLDVWILETNTVYRDVPFNVVSDWVQQGRLLETDRLRPSGTAVWAELGQMSDFAAYLPKPEPYRAGDRAEALESVQVDFAWKRPRGDEDEDVDMIPLIDVSLVLLIFFMMTSSVASSFSSSMLPTAIYGKILSNDPRMLMIGIEKGQDGSPRYSLAAADQNPAEEDNKLSESQLLQRLDQRLQSERGVDVNIKADRRLAYDVIKRLTIALESRKRSGAVNRTFAGVSVEEQR